MQKVLITGATGYIGNYTSRIFAATKPHVTIYAMSRQPPAANIAKHPQMAAFGNIQFVQGDCLTQDKLPTEILSECDCVVHMVGSLIDSFNYKKLLSRVTAKGDARSVQECLAQKLQEMSQLNPMKAMNDLQRMRQQFEKIV